MKAGDYPVVMMDKSLLLKLELFDGTSQIVRITEEQATHLGINIAENGQGFVIPVTNEVQNVPQFVGTVQGNSKQGDSGTNETEVSANYMYKIIKPEDLDLKPAATTQISRGRPRKRPSEQITQEQSKSFKEPQVVIKQVRTRSGRITKPPRYIGQDFRVINTSEDVKHDAKLKAVESDLLQSNETEPHLHLEQHSKKRNIPSHYRCPTCKKAYLGKMKMLNHFNKYPDHGPVPNFCKTKHNSTWNFLILTTQKFKKGSKGVKFCQELTVLLENARILAKCLFKPVQNGESGYFIDEYLAQVFGIVPGDYILNENEFHKDASLHAFLEKKCTEGKNFDDVNKTAKEEEMNIVITSAYKNEVFNRNKEMHKDIKSNPNSLKVNDIHKQIPMNDLVESIQNKNANYSSHAITVENALHSSNASRNGNNSDQTFFQENGQLSIDTNNSLSTQKEKHFSINSSNGTLDKNNCNQNYLQENGGEKKHFLLNGHDGISFENLNNLESVLDSAERLSNDPVNYHTLNTCAFDDTCTNLRNPKHDETPGHKDDLPTSSSNKCNSYDINKHIMMGNDLLSQVDDLMLDNASVRVNGNQYISNKCPSKHALDNELLSHVNELILENVNNTEDHKQSHALSSRIEILKKHQSEAKKNTDYDIDKHIRMHNELLSHVDLILENIDTGQVSNILETSSNSDDIMNVDQFVNERFKKLTEPDMELQNTSLNLDLPPLDMFNFHTS